MPLCIHCYHVQAAAARGIAICFPDTSPRGANIEGEDESYDFGSGAGTHIPLINSSCKLLIEHLQCLKVQPLYVTCTEAPRYRIGLSIMMCEPISHMCRQSVSR
jgi:hypothetical protein